MFNEKSVFAGTDAASDLFNQLAVMSMDEMRQWAALQQPESILCANLAEDLIEEARALFSQGCAFGTIVHLLYKAVLLSPGLLLHYFYLWRFMRHLKFSDAFIADTLMDAALTYGGGRYQGLRYVDDMLGGTYQFLDDLIDNTDAHLIANRLVLYVADDLSYEDVFFIDMAREPHYLGRIEQPRLIYSPVHHTSLSANAQILAEEMIKRGKDYRIVRHCGTSLFVESRGIFGPSIDTLLFNQMLSSIILKNDLFRNSIHTAVEVGVGSGFLMLTAIRLLSGRSGARFFGFDISEEACAHSRRAAATLTQKLAADDAAPPDVQIALDGRGLARFADEEVELAFSNPPYLPYAPERGESVSLHGAIEGYDIYEQFLLGDGPRVLNRKTGVCLLLFSSLTQDALQTLLRSTPLRYEYVGEPLTVPLDLYEVASNPAWSTTLRKNTGLIRDYTNRFKVRNHTLHVLAAYWPENVLCNPSTGRIFS